MHAAVTGNVVTPLLCLVNTGHDDCFRYLFEVDLDGRSSNQLLPQ